MLKKLLSIAVCVAMVLSAVPSFAVNDKITIAMDGLCNGLEMLVSVNAENNGVKQTTIDVYKAVYTKNDVFIKATTEKIVLDAGEGKDITLSAEYDGKNGEYAMIYLWEHGTQKPLCEPISSLNCDMGSFEGEKIKITPATVFASRESQGDHNASQAGDGKLETYWSAKNVTENSPQTISAVFDKIYHLTQVGIAFKNGLSRSFSFSVEASVDGKVYETVLKKQQSAHTDDVQYFETAIKRAKFVRFTIYGPTPADGDNWVSVSEIEAYGSPASIESGESFDLLDGEWNVRAMTEYNRDYAPTLGTKLYAETEGDLLYLHDLVGRNGRVTNALEIKSITASQTPEPENTASNVYDGNLATKWTAENVSETAPATLDMELADGQYITELKMAFGEGENRTHIFKAEISEDGVNYKTVVEKTEAKKTNAVQKYEFAREAAKRVRITFYGRKEAEKGWIQVTEAQPCDSEYDIEGAGGVLVGKEFQTAPNKGRYNISFDMNFPSAKSNDSYWSGVTLSNAWLSGGADSSNFAALQMRFENENGKIRIRKLTSNRFNEGSLKDFFTTKFSFDKDIHFSLDVDPKGRKIDITVSEDGVTAAKRMIYFNYENEERTRPSTWTGREAQWILFNTGASAKCEYFVKNITVTHAVEETEETIEKLIGAPTIDNDNVEIRSLFDNQGSYEASLGKRLYGEVVKAPAESGIYGEAIHLYDKVGRETNAQDGAGGVAAYVDLPSPDIRNAYKIEFTMYAPDAGEYGGISLGSGRNSSVGNGDNPLAMQLRFRPSGEGIKLAAYDSQNLNDGNLDDLVGKYTPIDNTKPIHVSLVINPHTMKINLTLNDGVNYQTDKIKDFCGSYSVWGAGRKIDTLMINTGIGAGGDIYVGDIRVTDLGEAQVDAEAALNGVLRLMAKNGTGKYMHHNGAETVDFNEQQSLNYTRFVERGGLMDSDGVSFEVMNRPGYYLVIMPGDDNIVQVKQFEDTARFKANATFFKEKTNGGTMYASYRDHSKYLYDNSGSAVVWSMHSKDRVTFSVKSETYTVVGDDFKSGFRWDEWIPGYTFNQKWEGGNLLSYHNHTGVARSSEIVVKDGVCLLKATKDSNAHIGDKWGQDYANNYNFYDENGKRKGWTSFSGYVGVITARRNTYNDGNTADPYKFNKNSLIEGSFKQPNGARGYWTAFWLSGRDSWPPEIDIFEYMSRWGGSRFCSNVHRSTSSSEYSERRISDGSLQTKFHVYSLDWGDGFIDYYFDGECYKRVTGDTATFQKNCELIINNGLGGWEYEPNGSTNWVDNGLRIDWVRAYQW